MHQGLPAGKHNPLHRHLLDTGKLAPQLIGADENRFAAALAYLTLGQQDSVGFVTFDSQVRGFLKPSGQPSHLKEIVHLMNKGCGGEKTIIPDKHYPPPVGTPVKMKYPTPKLPDEFIKPPPKAAPAKP